MKHETCSEFLGQSVTKMLDYYKMLCNLDYLKQHRKVTYTNLLASGRLNTYLADIDRQAQECFVRLIEGMKQVKGKRNA